MVDLVKIGKNPQPEIAFEGGSGLSGTNKAPNWNGLHIRT